MDEIQRNQLGPELSESPERRPEEPSEPETVRPAEAENAPEAQAPEEASSLSSAPAPDEGQSPPAPACEVVEYYQPRETREVVEYYIQPRPLPRRLRPVQPAARKRKKKGLVIFLICTALLAALATGAHFWTAAEKTDSADHGSNSGKTYTDEMTAAVSIPKYEPDGDVQFTVTEEHGQELTAQEVYAKVNPSVVTVMVQLDSSMSVGTGVIFTADGYLLTNYHVVAGGTDCSVALSSGKTYAAKYVTGDSKNDVAVLKVQAEGLPAAEIGNSDDLTVGDRVYAIGNPLGVELRGTLTDGIVSAINRDVKVDGRTMGAGNKIDPSALRVADIYETSVCPLARVMRYELRRLGVKSLKVVYSTEKPIRPLDDPDISCRNHCICPPGTRRKCTERRDIPGSDAFVPPAAGLLLAAEAVRDLTKFDPGRRTL